MDMSMVFLAMKFVVKTRIRPMIDFIRPTAMAKE